ncbi:MAG: ribonuclease III [Anaerolineae bacterium]
MENQKLQNHTQQAEAFQQRLGIAFKDIELLKQALTHRSFVNEQGNTDLQDNERLEFLGDAILDYLTADMLFTRFPDMTEGEMTRLRSALVRTEALALIAESFGLGQALLMGKGEANSGGRERLNNLCGGFEAVIGAIYMDQGLQMVKNFILPRLMAMEKDVIDEAIRKDPRSQFQEWAQATHNITPDYRLLAASGPDHEKVFIVGVMVDETQIAEGRGKSKRAAAQDAAKQALKLLEANQLDMSVFRPVDVAAEAPQPQEPAPSGVGEAARKAIIDFFERVNTGFNRRS